MKVEKAHFRSCYPAVTERDLEAISNAIRDEFPTLIWISVAPGRRREISMAKSPLEISRSDAFGYIPASDWNAEVIEDKDGGVTLKSCPCWQIQMHRGKRDWAIGYGDRTLRCDLPSLCSGQISVGYNRHDPAERRIVNALWRQLRKCMIIMHKGSMHWAGHDACKWVLEGGPRRMIGGAWRPPADYVFPADGPYYKGTEQIPRGDDPPP